MWHINLIIVHGKTFPEFVKGRGANAQSLVCNGSGQICDATDDGIPFPSHQNVICVAKGERRARTHVKKE